MSAAAPLFFSASVVIAVIAAAMAVSSSERSNVALPAGLDDATVAPKATTGPVKIPSDAGLPLISAAGSIGPVLVEFAGHETR